MRRPLRLAVGSALAGLALDSGVAAAQQPTRLPAVVVNAAPERPGPRKVAGVVRDTAAVALDSVEVSITSLQRRVFSRADGTFLFTERASFANSAKPCASLIYVWLR